MDFEAVVDLGAVVANFEIVEPVVDSVVPLVNFVVDLSPKERAWEKVEEGPRDR